MKAYYIYKYDIFSIYMYAHAIHIYESPTM